MWGIQFGNQYSGTEDSLGQQFTKALTDAINVTSNIIRSIGKLLTSVLNVSETFLKGSVFTKLFTDSISMVDEAITAFKAMGLTLLDSIGLLTVFSKIGAFARTLTDEVIGSETLIKLKQLFRNFTDSIVTTDVYSRVMVYGRTLIDSIRASENYIMRLNGIVVHWTTIVRSAVGVWTDKVRGTASWSDKARVTSSWTDKIKQE